MSLAGPVCFSVLWSLLVLVWGQDPSSCSSMVQGVQYGSFPLGELFPGRIFSGCSWTVENPDPTKYSLYIRFNHHAPTCHAFAPMLLPLDHYLANQSCITSATSSAPPPAPTDTDAVDLCRPVGPHALMQFDKNFVQLCLTTAPLATPDDELLSVETLAFNLVEVLLINNENSSQFTCGVLCRWFEECVRSGCESEGCGITQTGCMCPEIAVPVPLIPATPHNDSPPTTAPPIDCCVTQTHSLHAIALVPQDIPQDSEEDDQKVKTQRPRSVDLPGLYQAQTGEVLVQHTHTHTCTHTHTHTHTLTHTHTHTHTHTPLCRFVQW
ncbi:hypothetical protein AAFF_G00431140 [Aldrovandia affinis]|uniref:Adhesion G protein-coupled receptor B N-terminal domain-containing protein n=1 Tax=Aldrovandia affinis TaxID=143900 RepID=A0AAD7WIC2_9TELE|nr:hypothetical protein AAFF_G00431140 [Aldrovandia affinis]